MWWLFHFPSRTSVRPNAARRSSWANLRGDDLILCQITSQAVKDSYAVAIADADFAEGGLKQPSHIRPNRLFTADSQIVLYRVGRLAPATLDQAIDRIVDILRG
jgi:mRNA interferase MazF